MTSTAESAGGDGAVSARPAQPHLLLRLSAPLVAFGGPTIDANGIVTDYPAASMVTGLLANALGVDRRAVAQLARLQERLVFGARIDRRGPRIRDFQTAQLSQRDPAWTTRGRPLEREGGAASFRSPHLRFRHYDTDVLILLALRLEPAAEAPDLAALAKALAFPARPLFFGRKPCLPSAPILIGMMDAADIHDALARAEALDADVPATKTTGKRDAFWPAGEGPDDPASTERLTVSDGRDWRAGVHAGSRTLIRGEVALPAAPSPETAGEAHHG